MEKVKQKEGFSRDPLLKGAESKTKENDQAKQRKPQQRKNGWTLYHSDSFSLY